MKNGPLEDVFPIENGDIPLLCYFTRGYLEFSFAHSMAFQLFFGATFRELCEL